MAKLTKRSENYSEWYNEVVAKAGLAENSPTRGSMIIKPYGYAIWEKMQATLDAQLKKTGHVNAYFPLLIPKSFFSKEASHVEGFAKECAVVTHYRLKNNPEGDGVVVDETAKLEEELIIRPTSETMVWSTYKNWIQSYRDLPLLCNQWVNIMRWEMRTRMFLRTSEFLWQEGHTAHATATEAQTETKNILEIYANFAEEFLCIPVIKGSKTPSERFAGAEDTLTIEMLMQDGKALQGGTSHFLGQNFAKAFDVSFQTKEGTEEYVWATSWGVTTRLIGALIMTHSDDNGLVLPPTVAPIQVVIVPIMKQTNKEKVLTHVHQIADSIRQHNITVKVDDDDNKKPGWKFAEYEMKGVPIRLAIGERDIENGTLEVVRRDTLEKQVLSTNNIEDTLKTLLDEIQNNLFYKAKTFRDTQITHVETYDECKEVLKKQGGFVVAYWDGTSETEKKLKEETQATIRCIPFNEDSSEGKKCVVSGQPAQHQVLIAKAY